MDMGMIWEYGNRTGFLGDLVEPSGVTSNSLVAPRGGKKRPPGGGPAAPGGKPLLLHLQLEVDSRGGLLGLLHGVGMIARVVQRRPRQQAHHRESHYEFLHELTSFHRGSIPATARPIGRFPSPGRGVKEVVVVMLSLLRRASEILRTSRTYNLWRVSRLGLLSAGRRVQARDHSGRYRLNSLVPRSGSRGRRGRH